MDEVFTIDGESGETVLSQLSRAHNVMVGEKLPTEADSGVGIAEGRVDLIRYSNGNLLSVAAVKNGATTTTRVCFPEEPSRYALVIGGQSLVSISSSTRR
jgi:hypothetical protein